MSIVIVGVIVVIDVVPANGVVGQAVVVVVGVVTGNVGVTVDVGGDVGVIKIKTGIQDSDADGIRWRS